MRSLEQADSLRRLNLATMKETMAICRMEPHEGIPAWVVESPFYAVTRTEDELSLVCPEKRVPQEIKSDRGWCCLKIQGPMALSETGVLASLTGPLAETGISVFVVSTFDTDYLLIKKKHLVRATRVLVQAGHSFRQKPRTKRARLKS
jgi:uncharacterized protein